MRRNITLESYTNPSYGPPVTLYLEMETADNTTLAVLTCKVANFYCFVRIVDVEEVCERIKLCCKKYCIFGGMIVAGEGLNGTVSGEPGNVDALIAEISKRFDSITANVKYSYSSEMPFYRMRVSQKKEIVTMGYPDINPNVLKGNYVDPLDWNAFINDRNVLLIDARNNYEIEIGTFPRAINPSTNSFHDFPKFVSKHLKVDKNLKVAMWCTGGIRCEKASAFMLMCGYKEVYHLQGGILKYLEDVPPEHSCWEGECYVFDNRVSVVRGNDGLKRGGYTLCRACRHTLSLQKETTSDDLYYVEGISCRYCYGQTNERPKARQLQIALAGNDARKHLCAKAHQNNGNELTLNDSFLI